jgi:2-dehydro-3-deoxygalactonokinase
MAGEAEAGEAFDRGVEAARAGTLLADLFGIRAGALLGRLKAEDAVSYASGLLIGADVAAGCAWSDAAEVWLLAGEPHASLYTRALALHGRTATVVSSHDAFIAGARLIQEHL